MVYESVVLTKVYFHSFFTDSLKSYRLRNSSQGDGTVIHVWIK